MMSEDKEKIKNFLIKTTVIQNDRTIEEQLLYFRNGSGAILIVISYILYWAAFNTDGTNYIMRIVFASTMFLAVIYAIFTLKKSRNALNNWILLDVHCGVYRPNNSLGKAVGGGIFGIIIILDRSSDFFGNVVSLIFIASLPPLLLMMMNIACFSQYKLYLLRKCCPDLKKSELPKTRK